MDARTRMPDTGDLARDVRHVERSLAGEVGSYRPDGHVDVTLVESDQQVVLTVGDDGEGIDDEDVGEVFGRFFRGQNARRRQIGGTGLGLHIDRTIVEAHGGRVSVDSTAGEAPPCGWSCRDEPETLRPQAWNARTPRTSAGGPGAYRVGSGALSHKVGVILWDCRSRLHRKAFANGSCPSLPKRDTLCTGFETISFDSFTRDADHQPHTAQQTLETHMKSKAPRLVIALVAVVSLVGMTAPADAAAPAKPARSVWCC